MTVVVPLLNSRYETHVLAALHALDLFCKTILPLAETHCECHTDQSHPSYCSSFESTLELEDEVLKGYPNDQVCLDTKTHDAGQLHKVLLGLSKLKISRALQKCCENGGGIHGKSDIYQSSLNISHRARRIVDVISELELRFLGQR